MADKRLCKVDFKEKKECTLKSLNEVECFLNKACKCFKIGSFAKFLKKN